MNKKILILAALAVMLFAACGDGNYTPKPEAYLRIDLPEHEYWLIDTLRIQGGDTVVCNGDTMVLTSGYIKTFPFSFEANTCVELTEKDAPAGERWIDVMYPKWNGVVFLTYKRLESPDSLRGQVDISYRLIEQHFNFSSGVEEQQFENPENRVFATTYHIKGRNVASTYQFWATDSSRHFLRGALYINESPNNDSLAPVLDYLQKDVDHLIETLRWK